MKAQVEKFVVACDQFVTRPTTQAAAEKRKAEIEAGGHCPGDHQVLPATPDLLKRAR